MRRFAPTLLAAVALGAILPATAVAADPGCGGSAPFSNECETEFDLDPGQRVKHLYIRLGPGFTGRINTALTDDDGDRVAVSCPVLLAPVEFALDVYTGLVDAFCDEASGDLEALDGHVRMEVSVIPEPVAVGDWHVTAALD